MSRPRSDSDGDGDSESRRREAEEGMRAALETLLRAVMLTRTQRAEQTPLSRKAQAVLTLLGALKEDTPFIDRAAIAARYHGLLAYFAAGPTPSRCVALFLRYILLEGFSDVMTRMQREHVELCTARFIPK